MLCLQYGLLVTRCVAWLPALLRVLPDAVGITGQMCVAFSEGCCSRLKKRGR